MPRRRGRSLIEEKLINIKGSEYAIVMGDWNASVGEDGEENYIGKYVACVKENNERRQKLLDFCKREKLIVAKTWLQQEKRRRYRWKSPGDGARYQLAPNPNPNLGLGNLGLHNPMVKERNRNRMKTALPGA